MFQLHGLIVEKSAIYGGSEQRWQHVSFGNQHPTQEQLLALVEEGYAPYADHEDGLWWSKAL